MVTATIRSDVRGLHLDHTPMSSCEMASPCEAAATKAADTLGCSELKQDQMQVVTAVLRGQDVFAVLATERRKTQVTPHDTPRGPAECCSVTVIYHIM